MPAPALNVRLGTDLHHRVSEHAADRGLSIADFTREAMELAVVVGGEHLRLDSVAEFHGRDLGSEVVHALRLHALAATQAYLLSEAGRQALRLDGRDPDEALAANRAAYEQAAAEAFRPRPLISI
ncbi:MAG: hypothetical protein WKF94_12935 [Solirubrobacteraceae bacterium]